MLNDKDEIDYTASTAARIITFVVNKDFLEAAFQSYFNEPFDYDKVQKRIQLKENAGVGLRTKAIESLTGLMTQSEKLQSDPAFHDKTEFDILQLLFQAMDLSRERRKVLESDMYANQVREYIELHYNKYLNMNEIYASQKFSPRTVRLGFNHLFGFSPKKYLQQYRLGRVHHALLKNTCDVCTVGSIAFDHGFSHMGRFSEDYKSMYAKTPHSTLQESSYG